MHKSPISSIALLYKKPYSIGNPTLSKFSNYKFAKALLHPYPYSTKSPILLGTLTYQNFSNYKSEL